MSDNAVLPGRTVTRMVRTVRPTPARADPIRSWAGWLADARSVNERALRESDVGTFRVRKNGVVARSFTAVVAAPVRPAPSVASSRMRCVPAGTTALIVVPRPSGVRSAYQRRFRPATARPAASTAPPLR